jgi:hypothetical protein
MARLRRVQIREEQRPVRARLRPPGADSDSVDTVANAFIVGILMRRPRRAIDSRVQRVHRVRTFKPLLDHALALHHVPRLESGRHRQRRRRYEDRVIDTGIDMDHAGFYDPSLPIPDGFRANPRAIAFTTIR